MEVIQRSTSTVLTIPQEIIDHIIDLFIAESYHSSLSTHAAPANPQDPLATISTICRAFVIPTQQQLFSERHLNTSADYGSYNAILAHRPHIAAYTRSLSLKLHDVDLPSNPPSEPALNRFPVLTQVLRRLTSVQCLEVRVVAASTETSWQTLGPDLQSAILYATRLPSLRSLSLIAIRRFDFLALKPSSPGQTLTLFQMAGVEDGEDHEAPPVDLASQVTPGYSILSTDRIGARAWEQLVKRSSLSITHLEVTYPSAPSHVNLSDLPLLRTLKVRVWHTGSRGRETRLAALLRSATATTTTTAMGAVVVGSSGITDIDCTIQIFHPLALRDACAGLDAVLSGAGYRRLRRFSLHIACGPFDEGRVLEATGDRDLPAYYRRQLAGLAARGVLDLKVTWSTP